MGFLQVIRRTRRMGGAGFGSLWPKKSLLLSHVLDTYATQVLMAVLTFGTGIVISRVLGPIGRGEYAAAMATGTIGVQLGNMGLHATNSYSLAKNRGELPSLLANSLCITLLMAVLMGGLVATASSFPQIKAPVSGSLLWLAAAWVPAGLGYLLVVNLLMGLHEVKLYNRIELFNKLLGTGFVLAVIALGARKAEAVVLAALIALLLSFGGTLRVLARFARFSARPSASLFRNNFQLGWKAYLCAFFAFLVIRIDLLMVKSMLGSAAAGAYSVAGTMADCIFLLPAAIGSVLFPKLAAMTSDVEKRFLIGKAALATGLSLLALVSLLAICSKLIIVGLFGQAFASAVPAFWLICPGIVFLGIETVLVQYLNSCGFPVSVVLLWVFCTLFNITVNLRAIPAYGINGAAAVSSISYFIAFLGVCWIMRLKATDHHKSLKQRAAIAVN